MFSEKVSTRQKALPEREAAIEHAVSVQTTTGHKVALTVTALDRVGRDAAELMAFPGILEARGLVFEMLGGPLSGIYDPSDPSGRILFAVAAAMAEGVREGIREKTLDGLDSAARKGNHGGRPAVIDDDMIAIARRRHAKGEPMGSIAAGLVQQVGKNKGKPVSRTALYEAIKRDDEESAAAALRAADSELVLADDTEGSVPGQLGVPLDR